MKSATRDQIDVMLQASNAIEQRRLDTILEELNDFIKNNDLMHIKVNTSIVESIIKNIDILLEYYEYNGEMKKITFYLNISGLKFLAKINETLEKPIKIILSHFLIGVNDDYVYSFDQLHLILRKIKKIYTDIQNNIQIKKDIECHKHKEILKILKLSPEAQKEFEELKPCFEKLQYDRLASAPHYNIKEITAFLSFLDGLDKCKYLKPTFEELVTILQIPKRKLAAICNLICTMRRITEYERNILFKGAQFYE